MTEGRTSRRGFIGALAFRARRSAPRASRAAPAQLSLSDIKKDTDVACLYHCDFGDVQRFSQMLTNMNNHLSAYEFDPMRVKLVIVTHGPGIKFFLADRSGTPWEKDQIDEDIYKRFVGLTKFGVEAYLCEITYKRQNIDWPRPATIRS